MTDQLSPITNRKSTPVHTVEMTAESDPQAIFYLNPIPAVDYSNNVFTTLYTWAPKIEATVEKGTGKGDSKAQKTLNASWGRSRYRAYTVDFIAKETPWLYHIKDQSKPHDVSLTGEYRHDKSAYRKVIQHIFQQKLPEIPLKHLQPIERYILETVMLGAEQLEKGPIFTLTYPCPVMRGEVKLAGIRVVSLSFNQPAKDQAKKTASITEKIYEAGIKEDEFKDTIRHLDKKTLEEGKMLVSLNVFDINTF